MGKLTVGANLDTTVEGWVCWLYNAAGELGQLSLGPLLRETAMWARNRYWYYLELLYHELRASANINTTPINTFLMETSVKHGNRFPDVHVPAVLPFISTPPWGCGFEGNIRAKLEPKSLQDVAGSTQFMQPKNVATRMVGIGLPIQTCCLLHLLRYIYGRKKQNHFHAQQSS